MTSKGLITLVHLYPREMSIYGDLGNTRCLASRIRRHGYDVAVHDHHPGSDLPDEPHMLQTYNAAPTNATIDASKQRPKKIFNGIVFR